LSECEAQLNVEWAFIDATCFTLVLSNVE